VRRLPFAFAFTFAFTFTFTSNVYAQAEPAPESYVPPSSRQIPGQPQEGGDSWRLPPEEPKWHIAIAPRLAIRLGNAPDGTPLLGLGGGVQIHRALVPLGRVLRFGVGFDFAYDRVFRSADVGTQQLAHATFAGVLVFDALVGPSERLRPFLAVGGGLSVGNYEDPATPTHLGASIAEALGLVHLSLGLSARVYQSFTLGVHAEANLTFSSTTAGAPPVAVFQPGFLEVALDFGFRF
jgi:hypothetical protein